MLKREPRLRIGSGIQPASLRTQRQPRAVISASRSLSRNPHAWCSMRRQTMRSRFISMASRSRRARIGTQPKVLKPSWRSVRTCWRPLRSNEAPGPAGFLVRGGVLPLGQGVPIHTNSSWKTSETVPARRRMDQDCVRRFDGGYGPPTLGALGTGPWGAIGQQRRTSPGGFASPRFPIDMVAAPSVTGSVVAFTFDPMELLAFRSNRGPIARLIDDDNDGQYRSPRGHRDPGAELPRSCFHSRARCSSWATDRRERRSTASAMPDKDGEFEQCELIRRRSRGHGRARPARDRSGSGRVDFITTTAITPISNPPIDPTSPVNVAYEGELLPPL